MDRLPSLLEVLADGLSGDELFDTIPDTVYFIKDRKGRYSAVNQTLVERTSRGSKQDLLGRTADEIFPGSLGRRIAEQDRAIMDRGRMLAAELELHLYSDCREGWCLTWKSPLRNAKGEIVGLFGMSRDVKLVNDRQCETEAISAALAYARLHLDQSLRIGELAAQAGLSTFKFDQRIRRLFGMSAGQYVTRLRIDHACERLRHGAETIAEIALECGYADQTAFSRQFRKVVRLSPQKYRSERLQLVRPRSQPDRHREHAIARDLPGRKIVHRDSVPKGDRASSSSRLAGEDGMAVSGNQALAQGASVISGAVPATVDEECAAGDISSRIRTEK